MGIYHLSQNSTTHPFDAGSRSIRSDVTLRVGYRRFVLERYHRMIAKAVAKGPAQLGREADRLLRRAVSLEADVTREAGRSKAEAVLRRGTTHPA